MSWRGHPIALAMALMLAGCGGGDAGSEETAEQDAAPALQASDFPALNSAECVDVAQFYFEALGGHEFAQAALAWDDPAIDAARLAAVFGTYKVPEITWGDPFVEQSDGEEFCSVSGVLTDATDTQAPAREGTLLLQRRAGDRERWLVQSSTFIESLQRSATNQQP